MDDFYQRVVEDFGSNLEYALKQWGEENVLEYSNTCPAKGTEKMKDMSQSSEKAGIERELWSV